MGLSRDVVKEPVSGNLIITRDYLVCGPRWYAVELAATLEYRTDLALREVHCPVLVMRGTRDPVAGSDWCTVLAAAAPHGYLRQVARHRHLVHYGAAALVAADIERHARRHPPVAQATP